MKKVICIILIIFPLYSAFSQSNTLIGKVLEMDYIDFKDSVYLALVAGNLLPEEATPEEALEKLKQLNWKIEIKGLEEPVTLSEVSLLIMNSLELKGGIMFSLFHIQRYAVKEMIFRNLITHYENINRKVSGKEFLIILGNSLEEKKGDENA